jgi:hypothetical protein
LAQVFAQLPLPFEPTVGQVTGPTAGQVDYMARGPGFALFLTGDGAVISLPRPDNSGMRDVLKVQFQGSNPAAQVVGQQELTSRSNYFSGNDPAAWHGDVPQYGQVA